MSQENVEVVRQATDAYNRGAFDEAARWIDPEIEWDMSRVEVPDAGVFKGLEGMLTFFSSWDESWDASELDPQEFLEVGDKVVSVIRQRGRGRLSGVEVEQTLAQVWTLRNGKIVRMEMYPDPDAALEAVGLRE